MFRNTIRRSAFWGGTLAVALMQASWLASGQSVGPSTTQLLLDHKDLPAKVGKSTGPEPVFLTCTQSCDKQVRHCLASKTPNYKQRQKERERPLR